MTNWTVYHQQLLLQNLGKIKNKSSKKNREEVESAKAFSYLTIL